MEIQQKSTEGGGSFFIEENDNIIGEIFYTLPFSDRMVIEHTEVNERARGTGASKKLVATAIDYARAKKLTVVANCHFARAVIAKTPEYHDVLYTGSKK